MKKILHTLHLYLGLLSGIVIFTVAITGCIVAFEEELRAYSYSELFEVTKGNNRLSLDELKLKAIESHPNEGIKSIRILKDETASVEIQFQDRLSVFVDPYSGKILGSLNRGKDFYGKVLRLHRNLMLDDAGEWITGISALVFFFMIISGIILWWPTNKRIRKEKLVIKRKTHWIKMNYDLHSVLGFYASWMILFTVLTALIWSFEWAEQGMFALTNSTKEKRMEITSNGKKDSTELSLSTVYLSSIELYPESSELIMFLPEDEKGSIRTMHRYNSGFFKRQDNVFYDQYTGEIIKDKPFDSFSTGMKLRISNENIHTGRAFGLVGRWIVFFASLICASLPITGFLIWNNKRKMAKQL
ncbi:MAG: hypothetical protein RI922_461 [Bacteroidota bacterium]|jgi:uncharacterized iron-regulated membrane protein